jgi:hypothetical protein
MTEKYVYRDREIFFDFSKTGSKIYAFLKSLDNYLTSCELSPNPAGHTGADLEKR